jgi:methyl-accepting chemotaxis protein
MSLKLQLILFSSLISVMAAVLTATAISNVTFEEVGAETNVQYNETLTAKRKLVGNKITDYFHTIENQVTALAFDQSTRQAAAAFIGAFDAYLTERASAEDDSLHVKAYYNNEFGAAFRDRNDHAIELAPLIAPLSANAIALQNDFIATNPHPRGEKDSLDALNNGTTYSALHGKYHPSFRNFLKTFSYYDIFIVDAKNGNIVYSVFKELDYATSLLTGPYADSGIAEAFKNGLNLEAGETYLTDFDSYVPSYDDAASFISSPIFDNGKLIAILIFQMPINEINSIMTQNGQWREAGFRESGETYLVGQDGTLRNESRFFIEDPDGYISILKRQGISAHTAISAKGTSIALQPVDSIGARKALAGESGYEIFTDYRGISVLSSYGPITVGNQQWAILSEIDEAEAYQSTNRLLSSILTWTAGAVIFMSLFAIVLSTWLAKRTTKPLHDLSDRLADLAVEEADLTQRIRAMGTPEIDDISMGFNRFLERLQGVVSGIKDATNEIASASTELSTAMETSKDRSESQSKELRSISKSIGSFVTAIANITQRTEEANEETALARGSSDQNVERAELAAENIQQLVSEVTTSVDTIQALQQEVDGISEVLSIINSIADQTNLLALNAAIEAARAGEHGRGFAVVADEVRTLASKTQQSTYTIQAQIGQLSEAANSAVSSMERASVSAAGGIHLVETVSSTLKDLNGIIGKLSEVNDSVAQQSQQQTFTVKFINKSVNLIAENSDELSVTAVQVLNATEDLSAIAHRLDGEASKFTT